MVDARVDASVLSTPRNCNDDLFIYFASNFTDRLKDFTEFLKYKNLPEPTSDRGYTLSESVDACGRFTEEHGHLLSFDQNGCGKFDFSNRFEAEEVEWILNEPYYEGRTALQVEILNQRADVLEALLKHGGNRCIIYNTKSLSEYLVKEPGRLALPRSYLLSRYIAKFL